MADEHSTSDRNERPHAYIVTHDDRNGCDKCRVLPRLDWLIGGWSREGMHNDTLRRSTITSKWALDNHFIRMDIVTTYDDNEGDAFVLRELRMIGGRGDIGVVTVWMFDNSGVSGIAVAETDSDGSLIGGMLQRDGETSEEQGILRPLGADRLASHAVERTMSGGWFPTEPARVFIRDQVVHDIGAELDTAQERGYLITSDFVSEVSSYEMLKPLDWFLGDWVHEDDSGTRIIKRTTWILGRGFMQSEVVTESSSSRDDAPPLEQLIVLGWDHRDEMHRQWTFDNKGRVEISVADVGSREQLRFVREQLAEKEEQPLQRTTIWPLDDNRFAVQVFEQDSDRQWRQKGKRIIFERRRE